MVVFINALYSNKCVFRCIHFVLVEIFCVVLLTCSNNLLYSRLASIKERSLIYITFLFFALLTLFMIIFRSDYSESSEVDRLGRGSS